MLTTIRNISDRLKSGDTRTSNVVRNTLFSGLMKICSLLCSLIMVPITIHYLNAENYGIWMAMTSILYWFAFFDVGLGNGMRNYLSAALSRGDWTKARSYFSTAMILLAGIALILGVIALPSVYLFDLNAIFNAHNIDGLALANALAVAVIFSLIQFVVKNIGMVYIAMQKYAINDLIVFLGNLSSVAIIYALTKTTTGSLIYVVTACTAMPVVVFCLASIPLLKRYPQLIPSFASLDMSTARNIVSKGLGFFIIQITSCLIIFGSTNILISHFCGPEQVTVYNIAYKLFNVLVIGFTILISPLWNAYTDAAVKNDYGWISACFKKSLLMWLAVTLGGIVLLLVSPYFFDWWIGDSVHVPFGVSVCVLAYVCAFNFANCTASLLNGMNIIRVHVLTAVVASAIYLTIVGVMGGRLGVMGIALCMAASYVIMGCIYLYQDMLVIRRSNTGIWAK